MDREGTRLNAICPYFTMFPLDFPLTRLRDSVQPGWVFDPFCGRGTTGFAARLMRLPSVSVDSSPVACAISSAKQVSVNPADIVDEARTMLSGHCAVDLPQDDFWRHAYHEEVLQDICRIRESLLEGPETPARTALRGLMLGALHGPLTKSGSYLSNQAPRTYAPKPAYSVRYWSERGMRPPRVDTLQCIARRAFRYYTAGLPETSGATILGDNRESSTRSNVDAVLQGECFSAVITSPPYYGLRTYIPDQWLRYWFVGGPAQVAYERDGQLSHASIKEFTDQLRSIWQYASSRSSPGAMLIMRFGTLNHRNRQPAESIARLSLENSGWAVETVADAGKPPAHHRQAQSFSIELESPAAEVDIVARLA